MTTRKEHHAYGTLEGIIERMEDVRDSLAEILSDLEELDESYQFYRAEGAYGLPPDENNGDEV
jgi:hypothetical protein